MVNQIVTIQLEGGQTIRFTIPGEGTKLDPQINEFCKVLTAENHPNKFYIFKGETHILIRLDKVIGVQITATKPSDEER